MGGFAALYLAVAYLTGIVLFLFVLDYPSIVEPAQKVALVVDKQMVIYITNLFMYVIFGFFLVVLALALYERLKAASAAIIRTATAVGIIWAGALIASGMVANAGIAPVVALYGKDPTQAALTWLAIESVANGLGGANGEILGGLFTLFISWAALQVNGLPKGLSYLGILVGAVGIISTVPGLSVLTGLFGMSQILWFIWLGIVLLRRSPSAAV
ncbi:MAG: DUF4386 family protein [Anaerolineae bacterium]|nr:DUF4386 family protein [Anaerolineae bacterium]MCB9140578.1 DUF4386 family protein [Caldilineaceae bacterium]